MRDDDTRRSALGRWFRTLERLARFTIPTAHHWDLAAFPAQTRPWCVVLDGFLSQANSDHIANRYLEAFSSIESKRTPCIRGFSYNDQDRAWTYSYQHTFLDVLTHTDGLQSLVECLEPTGPIVPIAFSMGGAVLLLALDRLLHTRGSDWVKDRVPLVVLIQPAIFGCPNYDMLGNSIDGSIPLIAYDLGPPDGVYPSAARNAVGELLDAGVAVNIISRTGDPIAPYRHQQERRLWQLTPPVISLQRVLPSSHRADSHWLHGAMPRASWTVNFSYHLVKALISWDDRPQP